MGAFALRHDFRRDLAADVEDPGEKQESSSTIVGKQLWRFETDVFWMLCETGQFFFPHFTVVVSFL